MKPEIRVEGIRELNLALTEAGQLEHRKEFRAGLKAAADVGAQEAKRRVVSRTGRARGAIRATSGGNRAYIVGGKASVPYYGWLDFGTRRPKTGNPRSVGPWFGSGKGPSKGRFIYPAIDDNEARIRDLIWEAIDDTFDRLRL